jgi:hypothetical protein
LRPKLFNGCAIPLLGYVKNLLGFITYILKHERVLPKPTRKIIPYLEYSANTMGSIILVWVVEGVLLMPRNIQFTCTTLLRVSHKTFGLHNTSFGIWKGIT